MRTLPRLCFLIFVNLSFSACLHPQETRKPSKFEAGTQFTFVALRQGALISNEFLLGGRFTFNAYRWLGLDSEWDFTPQKDAQILSIGGRRSQFLFGPKVGFRTQKIGFFAKGRGGFTTSGKVLKMFDFSSFAQTFGRHTNPVIDLGGVIEVYPGKRWLLRYDISDLVIQHNNGAVFTSSSPFCAGQCSGQVPDRISHSFQFSTGISYRF